MTYQVNKDHLAGFDLIGYRQPDGTILLGMEGNQHPMADFPEEAEILGNTYTLEKVRKNDPDDKLKADHPGKNIEWGLYV